MITEQEPETRLDPRYSDPEAVPPPWSEVERLITGAELFWISTVRPDGRPHVTPFPGSGRRGAAFLHRAGRAQGPQPGGEPAGALTTGTSIWNQGYDLVVEGEAVRVADDARLRELAAAWEGSTAASGTSRSGTATSITGRGARWCSRWHREPFSDLVRGSRSARRGGGSNPTRSRRRSHAMDMTLEVILLPVTTSTGPGTSTGTRSASMSTSTRRSCRACASSS